MNDILDYVRLILMLITIYSLRILKKYQNRTMPEFIPTFDSNAVALILYSYGYHFTTAGITIQDPEESLNKAFSPDEWMTVIGNGIEKYFSPDANPSPLHEEWNPSDSDRTRTRRNRLDGQFRMRNPLDDTV